MKIRYGLTEVSHEDWAKRRESAIRELKHALLVPYYHFVINDNLDQAVLAVMKIASHESDEFHGKDDEARLMARTFLEKIIDFND